MNSGHLTERMPEVGDHRGEWTPEESTHLEACAECAEEWRIVLLSLSGRAESPSVDSAALTTAVLQRLSTASSAAIPVAPRSIRWRPLLGLAAAAAVVLVVAVQRPQPSPDGDTAAVPVREPTLLPELDGLLDDELELLLASIEIDQAVEAPIGPLPRLGDLTEAELELLLKEVEG